MLKATPVRVGGSRMPATLIDITADEGDVSLIANIGSQVIMEKLVAEFSKIMEIPELLKRRKLLLLRSSNVSFTNLCLLANQITHAAQAIAIYSPKLLQWVVSLGEIETDFPNQSHISPEDIHTNP